MLEASPKENCLRQLNEYSSLQKLQASITALPSQREMERGQLHQLSENTNDKLTCVNWYQ